MAKYIKVVKSVAAHLGLLKDREQTADGNYLLWQADLQGYQGRTLEEQAEKVGGAVLTALEAKLEHDGKVDTPAAVTDPFAVVVPPTDNNGSNPGNGEDGTDGGTGGGSVLPDGSGDADDNNAGTGGGDNGDGPDTGNGTENGSENGTENETKVKGGKK